MVTYVLQDYVNVHMRMSSVISGQREREPHHLTSRSNTGQSDEHQYEQPKEHHMLSIC